MEKKLLTKKDAIQYLEISQANFDHLIKIKEIGFKKIGKTKRFTKTELDRWLNDIDYHIDYIKEVKSTTRISRLKTKKEPEYSLEKARELLA